MRSSLLDVMGQDYMRTARAKGVSQFMILFKHALRNAILPVITYVGPMLASLMTGSFRGGKDLLRARPGPRLRVCHHQP